MSAIWLTLQEAAARAGRPPEEIRGALLMGELVGRPTDVGDSYLVTAESLEAHYGLAAPPPARRRGFFWPVAGGLLLGAAVSLSPGVLILPAMFGLILVRRVPLAAASAGAVILASILAPLKYIDTMKFEELSTEGPTLAELSRAAHPRMTYPEGMDEVRVQVPGRRPSIRQVADAIDEQTELTCEVPCCGNGSLLTGGGPYFIKVRRK